MGKGIPIHVLGTSFAIQTDENPEYVETLVSYVTGKVETLKQSIDTKDNMRLVVLASILIADELFKERKSPRMESQMDSQMESGGKPTSEGDEGEIGAIAESLIARLDEALEK